MKAAPVAIGALLAGVAAALVLSKKTAPAPASVPGAPPAPVYNLTPSLPYVNIDEPVIGLAPMMDGKGGTYPALRRYLKQEAISALVDALGPKPITLLSSSPTTLVGTIKTTDANAPTGTPSAASVLFDFANSPGSLYAMAYRPDASTTNVVVTKDLSVLAPLLTQAPWALVPLTS